jgi:2-keto-4-pentenoate hydratase/2-oxohepta-3-ene-1,7-dioic acid hydratase in catechol pathway
MKLFRYGTKGYEKPGVMTSDGKQYDLSDFFTDYNESFFEDNGIQKVRNLVQKERGLLKQIPGVVRYGCPVARPSKIICIGLNYSDHAKESNMEVPKEPVLFFKSTTALNGPFDAVTIPKGSEKTDWEVELAIIMGKKASYVTEAEAMDYVAAYTLHNDLSERAFQLERGGQWVKGKSCDTFAPMGPFLVPKEDLTDVHNLRLWLKVNGEIKQDGNTKNLIFKVPFLVHYISQFMTLLPGDIISTGTPAGVGLGFNPPQYLKPGDVVELGIDQIGESKQTMVAFEAN